MVDKNTDNKPVVVDMTIAKSIELIPNATKVLAVIKTWKFGLSGSQAKKVHVEYMVVEPEKYKSRILFDDINLENENTLGRLLSLLKAVGMKESEIKVKKFTVPAAEDMEGKTLAGTVRLVKAEEGSEFGDKNTLGNFRPESSYTPEA